jgi:hypothetical protein
LAFVLYAGIKDWTNAAFGASFSMFVLDQAMQHEGSMPDTQPAPVLLPPRPPGPPTRTAIALSPELPDPDDSNSRNLRPKVSLHDPSGSTATANSPAPLKAKFAAVDKALAIAAAAAGVIAAVAVWGRMLLALR